MGSPPVLFGCGNKALLEKGGIAVVGSRNADKDELAFAENIGSAASAQGYSIVSGGARGVDQCAMFSALQKEGTAIGVLADSLMRAATSAKYRKYLLSNDLVLTTPFNPEAGFNVGNAMSRNRYIYCLADAAVVASSTPNRGGTWNGAVEDLKADWVPLWVKRTHSEKSGNSHLVRRGARWIPDDLPTLEHLLNNSSADTCEAAKVGHPLLATSDDPISDNAPEQRKEDFYELFQNRVLTITENGPLKPDEIALCLKLQSTQVKTWLQQGIDDGKITKLTGPVRYQSTAHVQHQESLFAADG